MSTPLKVLFVEDSEDDAVLLARELRRGGYEPHSTRVDTPQAMAQALDEDDWEIVIADYALPRFSGLDALKITQARGLDIPFIIVSGNIGEDDAVAAMKGGAHDYVMKRNLSRLVPAIERELRETQERVARRRAEQDLRDKEAHLRAIVSNIPGVVFQLQLLPEIGLRFLYVSEGSHALLRLAPRELQADARRFLNLIDPADRVSFDQSVAESAARLRPANWEGRIQVSPMDDVKWVNLRFTPRKLADDSTLWEGIMANITFSKLAEQEIKESRQRLSELSSHLEKVKEQERTRIAREIHDDIGGNLTAIKIDLLWLQRNLSVERSVTEAKITALDGLVDQTMEIASRIGRDLRPGILDLGLLEAIEWQAREFEKRLEIPCQVTCDDEEFTVVPELATTLFSIFRETLTNISKHAHADCVEVSLRAAGAFVELVVTDDGRGISTGDMRKTGSFGLRGMQERASQLGGFVSIFGAPGQGTTVTVRLPAAMPSAGAVN